MKILALAAISFYQRYLSPLKGFNCAFRRHTGRDSCSAYGKRVIARHGLPVGLELLRRRLDDCHEIHQHYHPAMPAMSKRHRAQAGNCDLSCDASDVADVLGCSNNCTCFSIPSCRDWLEERRLQRKREHRRSKKARTPAPPKP
jgi:putative component of membrane protein insertase Oxa1/YidC/SpoIIIJ protein YidD